MVELRTRKSDIERRWGNSSWETGTLKNFVWEPIYHPRWDRYESWSGMVYHRWEVFPTQSGMSYPRFLISPPILHIVLNLHPPSLSFSSTTLPSSQNTKLSHLSLSLHGMIMSWHRVQHTPSTASTQDCLSYLVSHDYKLTPEWSFRFRRSSLHESSKVKSPFQIPMVAGSLTDEVSPGMPSIDRLQALIQSHSITDSKCISKVARSRPPNASPNSLDHGLQVNFQTDSITACKFAWSWPPTASPITLDHRLQVHLQTCSITISECISKFTRTRPPSVSPNTLDYPLQVHLLTRSFTASECICQFTWARSSCAPWIALKHHLQPVQIYRA